MFQAERQFSSDDESGSDYNPNEDSDDSSDEAESDEEESKKDESDTEDSMKDKEDCMKDEDSMKDKEARAESYHQDIVELPTDSVDKESNDGDITSSSNTNEG